MQKAREKAAAKHKLKVQLGLEDESESETDHEDDPGSDSENKREPGKFESVIHGGWSPDWSDCKLCKRACHATAR